MKPLVALMFELMGKRDKAKQITAEIKAKQPDYDTSMNPYDVSRILTHEG